MINEETKETTLCQRCKKNRILFICNSCPMPFDKLCFECDTYVHSIIPYKKLHKRKNCFNDITINIKNNIVNNEESKNQQIEEKIIFQTDIINKLKSENIILRENITQLIQQNNNLNQERDEYIKQINYLNDELERYKKENISIKEELNKNYKIINELNNNIKIFNDNLNEKEIEIEEIKQYYNNKLLSAKDEKEYLLKILDESNFKLKEKNNCSFNLKEENDFLKKRIISLEQENLDNLKIISQLHKENKELIHKFNRINNINI